MNDILWIFLDIGSTLIDESACIKKRCDVIIENNGIDRDAFYKKVIEYAKTDSNAVKSAASFFDAELPRWYTEYEKPYAKTENVLKKLSKKYKLGIIANQIAGTAERLDNLGILKYFDIVVTSDEAGCAKPDPEIFKIALNQTGCTADRCVMIGDRLDNDIVPAKKIGMKTVWVRQGFAKYQSVTNESETPDFTVETIEETADIFC